MAFGNRSSKIGDLMSTFGGSRSHLLAHRAWDNFRAQWKQRATRLLRRAPANHAPAALFAPAWRTRMDGVVLILGVVLMVLIGSEINGFWPILQRLETLARPAARMKR